MPPRLISPHGRQLVLDRPHIMGIVNLTPDSFSDGGRHAAPEQGVAHALQLLDDGADLLDLGGESTRPGAAPVSAQEEMDRVLPVLQALRDRTDCFVSIDTSSPEVMTEAIRLGADMINDVRALSRPGALAVAVAHQVPVCLMHARGEPANMQQQADYADVVAEVRNYLRQQAQRCISAGLDAGHLVLDPGFGFAKHLPHNLQLLADLQSLLDLGYPLLVGMSRKRMLGDLTGRPVDQRLVASVTAHLLAAQLGAHILRVHDVAAMRDALKIWQAVMAVQTSQKEAS